MAALGGRFAGRCGGRARLGRAGQVAAYDRPEGKRRAGAAHQRPGGAENAAKPPQAEKRAACAVCPAAGG